MISGTGEANTTNLTVLVDSSPVVLKGGSHVVFRNLTGEIQVEASNSSDLVHVVVKPSGNVRNIYIAAGGSGSLAILVYWYTLRTRARRH